MNLHFIGENFQATSELGGASNSLPRKLATFLMRPVKRSFGSEGEIAKLYSRELFKGAYVSKHSAYGIGVGDVKLYS